MTKGLRRSQSEWQAIIQQQQSSGLSVIVFCQRHDLCSKTFYRYRREIQSAKKSRTSSKDFIKIKKPSASAPTTSSLTSASCILYYQNCRLQIDSRIDTNWLAQIMKSLS